MYRRKNARDSSLARFLNLGGGERLGLFEDIALKIDRFSGFH